MIDHERIEDQIVLAVLGDMDPSERASFEAELAAHLPECRRCSELTRDYRQVGDHLALAVPPAPPPPGLEDRIVARATGVGGKVVRVTTWRRRLTQAALAAAAVIVLVIGSIAGSRLVTGSDELRLVRLRAAGEGSIAIAYTAGGDRALVVGSDLPDPGGERVMQLWVRAGGTMVPGGTFRPRRGDVLAVTRLPAKDFNLVAVTIEPRGGSKAPTSDPIAAAPA
ncbi:MAG: anti-sigma factor [Actinomycetota bacterium]|nr:anti-sigma factor [Actinomycetota bacterium]